jgi:hypothetical protein
MPDIWKDWRRQMDEGGAEGGRVFGRARFEYVIVDGWIARQAEEKVERKRSNGVGGGGCVDLWKEFDGRTDGRTDERTDGRAGGAEGREGGTTYFSSSSTS